MADKYGELVGCDNMHYAKVTSDTSDGYVAGALQYLAPTAEVQHEAKTDSASRYYDNKLRFVTIAEGETDVKITVSGVPCSLAADLTGKPFDSTKGIFIDTGDASNTPWCAMSGRMDLGDGGYRYFQYLKGKFAVGAQDAQTREDKTTVKTVDLTYTAVVTNYEFTMPDSSIKGIKGVFADTTDAAFTSGDNWFSQVQTPATTGSPSALVLSSSNPADDATGVATTVTPSLTFSNAIASDNVLIIKQSDNSIVATTKAYDSTGKILTLTPSEALTSAAIYQIVVAGVKDIYGQELTPSVINFTVA